MNFIKMKKFIKALPIVGPITKSIYQIFRNPNNSFPGSKDYWEQRYQSGGNSGAGSYNKLAEFKAEFLNEFVATNNVETIIEYGCGDGNQLKLAKYPRYLGVDVSGTSIAWCKKTYSADNTKEFKLLRECNEETAQLTMSLDVVYHLVEDVVFHDYMERLFSSSTRFVIVYSSNTESQRPNQPPHVRHRKFTDWVELKQPKWKLIQTISNKYPYRAEDNSGSFADFYIFGVFNRQI
jgi:SAM-dependent methyltransferase